MPRIPAAPYGKASPNTHSQARRLPLSEGWFAPPLTMVPLPPRAISGSQLARLDLPRRIRAIVHPVLMLPPSGIPSVLLRAIASAPSRHLAPGQPSTCRGFQCHREGQHGNESVLPNPPPERRNPPPIPQGQVRGESTSGRTFFGSIWFRVAARPPWQWGRRFCRQEPPSHSSRPRFPTPPAPPRALCVSARTWWRHNPTPPASAACAPRSARPWSGPLARPRALD
eukprot:scaffold216226_cov30-Tisochrysis_lutea.AAC.4